MMENFLNVLVVLAGLLVIISKYLDCKTTSDRITNISHEQNPIARKMMGFFGIQFTIWMIFVVVIAMVAIMIRFMLIHPIDIGTKIHALIILLVISALQFAVAHTNHYRKLNFVTRPLLKFFRLFKQKPSGS